MGCQSGESKYDFVEVMACPAGCIGGGGQPRSTDKQAVAKRQAALYDIDEKLTVRR
jgi:iron only hydrogenase large subunit-like protein